MLPTSLTLTLRIHDPREKQDAKKSTRWASVEVPREDLQLDEPAFAAKHLLPLLAKLEHSTLNIEAPPDPTAPQQS